MKRSGILVSVIAARMRTGGDCIFRLDVGKSMKEKKMNSPDFLVWIICAVIIFVAAFIFVLGLCRSADMADQAKDKLFKEYLRRKQGE